MFGLPNYPQRSKAGIWRNPLVFPAGRRPGFDPTHIASSSTNRSNSVSVICINNSFLNLFNAAALAQTGTPTAIGILGGIGPAIYNFTSGCWYSSPIGTPSISAVTIAATVQFVTFAQGFQVVSTDNSSSGIGNYLITSSGQLAAYINNTQISSGITLSINTPYFLAISYKASGSVFFVAVNLTNGVVKTASVGGVPGTLTSSSGNVYLLNSPGASSQRAGGYVSSFFYSQKLMSAQAILAWAQDPWSFWYPDPFNFDYVGAASVFAVTALFGARVELLGSSKASLPAPIANHAGLSAIPASKIELGAGLARAAAISGETVAGAATRASTPAEVAGAVAALRLAPIEAKASIAAARAAMVESIAAVTGVTRVSAEAALAALGLARAAIETAAGSQGALRLDVESLGALSASARVNLELVSSATTAVLAKSLIALEWLGGVEPDFAADLEWQQFPLHADPRFVIQVARRLLAAAISRRVSATTISSRATASYLRLPMPQGPDFSEMDVGETVTLAIDFARWLQSGETITSISGVTLVNYDPAGGAAYLTAVGSPGVGTAPLSMGGSGTVNAAVLQAVQGANPGVARMTATIATSLGNVYVGWAHQPVGTPD